jgi:hypothetical protein
VLACPGSIPLVQQAAELPPSDAANRGNCLHDAIEYLMLSGPYPKACEMLGFTAHGYTIDEVDCDQIEWALDKWNEVADEYGIEDFDCEQLVDFPRIDGAFGTIDVLANGPEYNMLIDWKFGSLPVDPRTPQLLYYATAASATPKVADLFDFTKPTVLVVIQPGLERVTKYEVENNDLVHFAVNLQNKVKEGLSGNGQVKMGPHCRWCPAKIDCPEQQSTVRFPKPYAGEDLAELLNLAERAADWAKTVQERALHDAEHGQHIPGWKLVNKRARRQWKDGAINVLKGNKYRVRDICEPQRLKSPAQLEKLGIDVSSLTTRTPSGVTLVRDSDERPATLPGKIMKENAR